MPLGEDGGGDRRAGAAAQIEQGGAGFELFQEHLQVATLVVPEADAGLAKAVGDGVVGGLVHGVGSLVVPGA